MLVSQAHSYEAEGTLELAIEEPGIAVRLSIFVLLIAEEMRSESRALSSFARWLPQTTRTEAVHNTAAILGPLGMLCQAISGIRRKYLSIRKIICLAAFNMPNHMCFDRSFKRLN